MGTMRRPRWATEEQMIGTAGRAPIAELIAVALMAVVFSRCADPTAAVVPDAAVSADAPTEVADALRQPPDITSDVATDAPDEELIVPVDASADASPPVAIKGRGECPGGETCPCEQDSDCDDGDPCTWGMTCQDAICGPATAVNCDDANVCTTDWCSLAGDCSHSAQDHWCEDGNPCTLGDTCGKGACQNGKPATCDDGNGCTADSCVVGQGCQFAASTAKCAEANDCVEASYCMLGQCVQGKGKPCTDGKSCTYDGCDPKVGCEFLSLPAPITSCDGAQAQGWCFAALKADGNWAQARKNCQKWGGELAGLRNADDNALGRKVADAACGKASAWIGLNDRAQEGKFVWANGLGSAFGNWNGGEPNDYGNEDAVEMVPDGGWNDLPEGAKLSCAVCVRPLQSLCDDGDLCTAQNTCANGSCQFAAAPTPTVSCDDANPCTLDGCAVNLGCGHTAVQDGSACGGTGVCGSGYCQWTKPVDLSTIATSCTAIKANGVHLLDPDGALGSNAPFAAYCESGWTLVLKVDGSKADGAYASPLWTEATPTAGASVFPDNSTARLVGYSTIAVQKVRLAMVVSGTVRAIEFAVQAANLRALLTAATTKTQLPVLVWESLLPTGSLQPHCLQQGFNTAAPNGVKARIGIFGNNEKDCGSVDSWIGVGATATICGAKEVPTVGNLACWGPDWGDAKTAALAWIFVR